MKVITVDDLGELEMLYHFDPARHWERGLMSGPRRYSREAKDYALIKAYHEGVGATSRQLMIAAATIKRWRENKFSGRGKEVSS